MLVKATHKVYGEVEVPKSWLRMWPNEYKPVRENKPVRETATSGANDEEDGHAADH